MKEKVQRRHRNGWGIEVTFDAEVDTKSEITMSDVDTKVGETLWVLKRSVRTLQTPLLT